MAVAIKPLEDRIVVKATEAETTTASGLVIPDTAKEKPQEGTVVAVGPGRYANDKLIPMALKEGDKVFFGKQQGVEIKHQGEKYYLFNASNIWAVIED